MRAMVFQGDGRALALEERPVPEPGAGEVLIRVAACGVCRTDLHLVDGELSSPKPGVIPGHEVVGRVMRAGSETKDFVEGERVGVPWLGWTCGACDYCGRGAENLCPEARFTGYTRDGGYADYILADARYAFPLPEGYDDLHAAPLLCAGLIGFRAYAKASEAQRLGLYGFGAAAHLLCQLAVGEGRSVYAFTKPGDKDAQRFARDLGACWAAGSNEPPPEPLDAALIFAPVGELVVRALEAVRPGGRVICAGIHMSDIPSFSYAKLWQERSVESVANLTRADGRDFLARIAHVPLETAAHSYPLEEANTALADLRAGRFEGAAVLAMEEKD